MMDEQTKGELTVTTPDGETATVCFEDLQRACDALMRRGVKTQLGEYFAAASSHLERSCADRPAPESQRFMAAVVDGAAGATTLVAEAVEDILEDAARMQAAGETEHMETDITVSVRVRHAGPGTYKVRPKVGWATRRTVAFEFISGEATPDLFDGGGGEEGRTNG